MMPEERDDAAQEPEADAPQEPEASQDEQQEPEAAQGEQQEPQAPEDERPTDEDPEGERPADEAAQGEQQEPQAPEDERPTDEASEDERPADEAAPGEPGEATPSGEAEPEQERPKRRGRRKDEGPEDEVIPGAHLEPDLVLDEEQRADAGYGELAEAEMAAAEQALAEEEPSAEVQEPAETEPVAREPLDLAADARYAATGKRKSAVARVILRPGEGGYTINGRHLDEYFPRVRLQRMARQPLEAAGYQTRMDVSARIHGGGVSAQATALRHGIARALVEADPALRGELKSRGYLTRDPRVKERKKAGLKKARKRPQFSKR
jgi:small subunit ribosomal protein S9